MTIDITYYLIGAITAAVILGGAIIMDVTQQFQIYKLRIGIAIFLAVFALLANLTLISGEVWTANQDLTAKVDLEILCGSDDEVIEDGNDLPY